MPADGVEGCADADARFAWSGATEVSQHVFHPRAARSDAPDWGLRDGCACALGARDRQTETNEVVVAAATVAAMPKIGPLAAARPGQCPMTAAVTRPVTQAGQLPAMRMLHPLRAAPPKGRGSRRCSSPESGSAERRDRVRREHERRCQYPRGGRRARPRQPLLDGNDAGHQPPCRPMQWTAPSRASLGPRGVDANYARPKRSVIAPRLTSAVATHPISTE